MKLTQGELDAIVRGDRLAIQLFQPLLTKCARAGARKAGILREDISADIQQEILIELMTGMAERIDLQYNIEPWIIETARRMALNIARKEGRYTSMEDLAGDHGDAENVMQVHGELISIDPIPDIIDDIDRSRVREKAYASLSLEVREKIYNSLSSK